MKRKSLLSLQYIETIVKYSIFELLESSGNAPQDALNLTANFLELGINSVLAVELVEAINQKLGIELSVEVIFDHGDVKELTAFIFQHYGAEDLSQKLSPLTHDVRLSKEGTGSSDSKMPVSSPPVDCEEHQRVLQEKRSSDIAIIGMSGRFAGSPNLEAFWSHLQAGESCIEPIRRRGWQDSTNSDPTRVDTSSRKWGGMLEHIDQFDPLFFNISPLEAAKMDPQQRLFLEEAYKSIEDAGYSAEQLAEKKVGVFVGARPSDYKDLQRNVEAAPCACPMSLSRGDQMDTHLFLGNDMAILAARISYFLNWKGPSLTIDTASSSSLVAIHLACESIRTGESEMALAGGVFVMSTPEYAIMAAKTQMLAPDGKCKTFAKSANGIVIGEGVGALLLKPLDTAIADGDHIYGVIRGSALNQDGRTKGMTAPNLYSQKALLSDLYKKAAIDPETVSYIEAHGTGSRLGDPIEVQALTEAFRLFTEKTQFCAIGSHKPTIGHTICSAGIAGVFKVLLAMKHQRIPPTINVEEVNPLIDFQNSPFFLNTELRAWERPDGNPRRAGVSSFGLSGTNCHLILEEPPAQQQTAHEQAGTPFFFPFSAKTQAALEQKMGDMIKWLEKEGGKYPVADISYTLVQGRSHFAMRSAVVARDADDLLQALRAIVSKGEAEHKEIEEIKETGKSAEQVEPLFYPYGNWLLQELLGNDRTTRKEYKQKIGVLADLYVKGYNLAWEKLFQKGRHQRVPLPTYPFIRESYWLAETTRDQCPHLLQSHVGVPPGITDPTPVQVSTDKLREALSHAVSHLLKVWVEEIDAETELSEYGFDSITFTELANRLNQSYQLDLTPAHFFEHSTLKRLPQYLQGNYAAILVPYFASAVVPDRVPVGSSREQAPALQAHESSIPQQHTRMDHEAIPLTLTRAEPIAIIGISGCFPQAPDVRSLWQNLLTGRDSIGEIPLSRWDWQTCFGNPATQANKTNVKWAGIVEDVELFDPLFFGISKAEAEQMDPQQRLLMMYVWKAIEDAGYAASSLSGTNTALLIGTTNSGYNERVSRAHMTIEGYSSIGQTPSVGPNRISYLLNLHGPSEAIETACSSSLVAIHRGVNAIESGQCGIAIVGGVNTLVSPELHISYSKAGMLCEDGRCKTFSAQANGYVRGEGVGILVLKKLSDAEQAGDHIYGVIRGSAENHGGRASSLTAPNPRAQADLLIAAYRKAGIDPRTVGYIEAHGTGTPLGDPIEINGLKTAFSELAQTIGEGPMPEAACGIGSLKSNIGHLELAAGVAGVIKVLLQLQHKQLVKSLHCEQLNPYIQLEGSPFYVVQGNREWEALQDDEGNVLPRRAGVSSFGFGGTNAHVVLEEYMPSVQGTGENLGEYPGSSPVQIILSAKNEERLHEQVRQLLAWVQGGTDVEEHQDRSLTQDRHKARSLQDLAYTLQVGREAMEERLALQVNSFAELAEKLRRYLQEPHEQGHWYRGQVKRHKEMTTLFSADEEMQAALQDAVNKWIEHGKYEKLLEWWVRGLTINWKHLYTVGAGSAQGTGQGPALSAPTVPALPRRMSLPTYPFVRERYWIPGVASLGAQSLPIPTDESTGSLTAITLSSFPALHPLVQRNISTLWEQQFSSTFCGDEFFLTDHVIRGQRIMPAAAYLEMARAAVTVACGTSPQIGAAASYEKSYLHLSHVVWARPLVVGSSPVTVHITLEPQESGALAFLISHDDNKDVGAAACPCPKPLRPCSQPLLASVEEEAVTQIYCQGRAVLREESAIPDVDLTAVQDRCQRQHSGTECYQRYRELAINYGPAHQGIEQLRVGEGEALARLRLPVAPGARTRADGGKPSPYGSLPNAYVLHPGVLDAALQACIGLLMEQNGLRDAHLPFVLEDLVIVSETPTQGWAWVRHRQGSTAGPVFDIEVCDDEGRVAVHLRGLSTRELSGSFDLTQTALLTPVWKEEAGGDLSHFSNPSEEVPHPAIDSSLVLLCELPATLVSRIQDQMASGGRCRSLGSAQPRREQRFQDLVMQLIQELQHLLRSRPTRSVLVQVVVVHSGEPSLLEALAGVLQTAQQEYPQLQGQLIEVDEEPEEESLLVWLRENQSRPHELHIRYREGKRWVMQWQEVGFDCGDRALCQSYPPSVSTLAHMPWKEGGCYLISGGAGGLARLFVQEIARQVQEVTIVLVGRSVLSQEQREQLESTGKRQIYVDYQQGDVSDEPTVHALIQRILVQYGHLDGIIHAVGVLRDSLLLNKTRENIQAVLAPKVIGVELLDEASSQVPLDFFILCSSIMAVMGNVGQADYAGANAYLDAFAHARQALVLEGKRQGVTLSINWPYWAEGGMQIEAEARQVMRQRLGIEPMGTKTGMKMLYQALASGFTQVMVVHGQVERIRQRLLQSPEPLVDAAPVKITSDYGHKVWQDNLRESLTHMVSRLLKVRVEEIDVETELAEYGFDSITFMAFANHLNQAYQLDLTPSPFFEHSTIKRLAQYLQTTYAAVLAPHFPAVAPVASGVTRKDFALAASEETGKVYSQGQELQLPIRYARVARSLGYAPASLAPVAVEPIAIVGMSGMFPQAHDIQSFWRNLLAGRDCISEIPPSRWDWPQEVSHPGSSAAKTNIKWAGVVEGIETFDPLFFGITPREAEHMDPQQRLLMMYVWKAIEDAGYAAASLSGTNTALFIGTMTSGYSERVSRARQTIESYTSISQIGSVGPNRMSYFLNLHGPSEPIETACSSSLIAIHRGVQAIESGQCAVAIVGGINTLVSPELHISFSKAGMLSEDGRCKPFSAQANGYVRGEGVGMLVLKKLSDAEQAGDHIYGVIRASAENHGGHASSFTAPNPRAQADLLIEAYRKAGIDPRTVGYIEAHGTGTVLGDPIEMNGLKAAFSELAQTIGQEPIPEATCGVGSVKSNIGHLELAAGVVSVIKVLLQMQHKKLVKSLHCEQINPYIQLAGSPFYIVRENQEWEAPRDPVGNLLPRCAGISSFGFGGANAHVVLEEYVPKPQMAKLAGSGLAPNRWPVVLSARTEEQLYEQARQLLVWLQEGSDVEEAVEHAQDRGKALSDRRKARSLRDLAYTLQVGRGAMEERLALLVSSLTELEEKLHSYLRGSQEGGDWYRGQVKRHKEAVEVLSTDEELQDAIGKWFQHGKYEKLLEWWVKGLTIDWKLLYTIGAGSEPHVGSAQGTIPTVPVLPRRISLPTYPFAQERYWIPAPKVEPTPGLTSHSPIGSIDPPSSESSPFSMAQPERQAVGMAQGSYTTPTPGANGNGKASEAVDVGEQAQGTVPTAPLPYAKRIALRPLAGSTVLSRRGRDDRERSVVRRSLPVPASTTGADQSQPPISLFGSDQSFARPKSNDIVVPFSALQLEEELARSLAEALYLKLSDIDVEIPFVDMGLDSVISVEWIQSLNKQYVSNLTASSVYECSTIRQLAGFLEKTLLEQGRGIEQTPVPSLSSLSLDDVLQQVQQGSLDTGMAEKLLLQHFL